MRCSRVPALHRALFTLPALIAFSLPCSAQQAAAFVGDFSGTMSGIHVMLHLTAGPNGTLTGTVDSPDQNLLGLALANVQVNGQGLSFTVPNVRGSWMGFLSSDGNTLSGMWNQGRPIQLNLARLGTQSAASAPATPQPMPQAAAPAAAAGCTMLQRANYWDGSAWQPLKQAAATQAKGNTSFVEGMKHPFDPRGGNTTILHYDNPSAALTLTSTPRFCFTFFGGLMPKVFIGALEVKGQMRQIELKQARNGTANYLLPLKDSYDLNQKQVADSIIEAEPVNPLPPGQYVVSAATSVLYDFMVQ